MSIYGHFNHQYYGNKIKFPKESFLIAGISHYQDNLVNISCNSELKLKREYNNKYDDSAIQILFNDNCIGYVPNNDFYKKMCLININSILKIINMKRESENKNFGIRVILNEYYSPELKEIGLF